MSPLQYEDVEPGVTSMSVVLSDPVEVLDFVRYAGASGDFTPLHIDEDVARAAGYPTVFGQGMFTAGVLSGFVTGWLGVGRTTRLSVRFKRQLFPGDTLTCSGTITDKQPEGVIEALLEVTDGRGEVLIEGTATATLPQRAERA